MSPPPSVPLSSHPLEDEEEEDEEELVAVLEATGGAEEAHSALDDIGNAMEIVRGEADALKAAVEQCISAEGDESPHDSVSVGQSRGAPSGTRLRRQGCPAGGVTGLAMRATSSVPALVAFAAVLPLMIAAASRTRRFVESRRAESQGTARPVAN